MECEKVTLPDYNFPRSQTEKRQWQQWSLKMNLRNHTLQDLPDDEQATIFLT